MVSVSRPRPRPAAPPPSSSSGGSAGLAGEDQGRARRRSIPFSLAFCAAFALARRGLRSIDHEVFGPPGKAGSDNGVRKKSISPSEMPFKKLRGGADGHSWKLVDWSDPVSPEEDSKFNCTWTTFTSTKGKQAPMCVHPAPDTVSDRIRKTGRWGECDILPTLWDDSGPDDASVYLDMGANVGACVLEMLLSTNATVVAFEPHPMNAFCLKRTVSLLDASMRRRLFLFPIGLGRERSKQTIRSGHNNMGNSMIGDNFVPDGGQRSDETRQFAIEVERLDAILDPKEMAQVRLNKIDVQGFECNILEGMGEEIANKIDLVKFEYSSRKLRGQNCLFDLLPRFREYGYAIYRDYANGSFNDTVIEDNITNAMLDLFASRKDSYHRY